VTSGAHGERRRNTRDANPPRPNVVILNPPTAWWPLSGRVQTLTVLLGYCCTAAIHDEEVFEKQLGRRDLNPRSVDPSHERTVWPGRTEPAGESLTCDNALKAARSVWGSRPALAPVPGSPWVPRAGEELPDVNEDQRWLHVRGDRHPDAARSCLGRPAGGKGRGAVLASQRDSSQYRPIARQPG